MDISGSNKNKTPIKGKNLNSQGFNTLKREDYGYAALFISINEKIAPEKAMKVLHKRLNNRKI